MQLGRLLPSQDLHRFDIDDNMEQKNIDQDTGKGRKVNNTDSRASTPGTDQNLEGEECFIVMKDGTTKNEILELVEELKKMLVGDLATEIEFDLEMADSSWVPGFGFTVKGPGETLVVEKLKRTPNYLEVETCLWIDVAMVPPPATVESSADEQPKHLRFLGAEDRKKIKCDPDLLCFVVGYGIDPSHVEFLHGQIKTLDLGNLTLQDAVPPSKQDMQCVPPPFQHETAVAGLIAGKTLGSAPVLTLIDVKVEMGKLKPNTGNADSELLGLDSPGGIQGKYLWKSMILALSCIKGYLDKHPGKRGVVNLSMGANFGRWSVTVMAKSFRDYNFLVVSSAGNAGKPVLEYWLAIAAKVLIVGSVNSDKHESAFSNYGHRIDLYAHGEENQSRQSMRRRLLQGFWNVIRRSTGDGFGCSLPRCSPYGRPG